MPHFDLLNTPGASYTYAVSTRAGAAAARDANPQEAGHGAQRPAQARDITAFGYRLALAPAVSRFASASLDALRTPDDRYLIVRERLWRAGNPHLATEEHKQWTANLMAARRAVKTARSHKDDQATRRARAEVDRAKRALGERGPVWWSDGAPDYNRRLVHHTPYGEWFERAQRFADAILRLLDARSPGASICPSEVARHVTTRNWRPHLEEVREAGRHLARQGAIVIRQRGRALDPDAPAKGPIRYAMR